MAINSLFTRTIYANNSSPGSYGSYSTTAVDVALPRGNYWVNSSLSMAQGNVQGPPGAGTGLVRYWLGNGNLVENGPNLERWTTNIFSDFTRLTFGCSVIRGNARADLWVFI